MPCPDSVIQRTGTSPNPGSFCDKISVMRYDNIIFSLYGTLVDISTDENDPKLWEGLAEFYSWQGAPIEGYRIRSVYDEEVRRLLSDARRKDPSLFHVDIDILKVFEAMYKRAGLTAKDYPIHETAEFFRERSTRSVRLKDGALDLLDALEDSGAHIYLLCNGQSSFSRPELRKLGIDDYFTATYFSSDYGMAKPEPAFYGKLLDNEGLSAEKTVMIGPDIDGDINGAKDAGIDSIFVFPGGEIPEGLKIPSVFVVKNGDLSEVASFLLEQ